MSIGVLPAGGGQNEQTVFQLQQSSKDLADRAKQVQTDITNARTGGAFTPEQQAQLTDLQNHWNTLISQQTLANQNYTNAVTGIGIANGLERFAPNMQADQVSKAVNSGLAKIADLQNQADSAYQKMRQGFEDDDVKAVQDAYTIYSDAQAKITANLKDINTITVNAAKDARDWQNTIDQQKYTQVTKPINDLATQAAQLGASPATVQKISTSKTVDEALAAAGNSLQNGKYSFQKTTDAFGNETLWAVNQQNPKEKFIISGGAGNNSNSVSPLANTTPSSDNTKNSVTGLSYAQYGLLANTDFDPNKQMDNMAQRYLDQYLKNGTVPSAYQIGIRGAAAGSAIATIDARARSLYYQATGTPMPNPEVIKANQQILANNLKMANNLKIQEGTVAANVDLSLANLKANNLNSTGFAPLNAFINTIGEMFQDPNVGQLLSQNQTIQNELGSLMAVKNASGTTVYDKLASAGIISSSDSEEMVKQKVNTLLSEARNFADNINSANAGLYKQIDPLEQDPNNPTRGANMRTSQQKIIDYGTNNPSKRSGILAAQQKYMQDNNITTMTQANWDELMSAFPEAEYSIPTAQKTVGQ